MVMTKREIIQMQIKRIENEIRDTPYHKGTEHHIGLLRAKLSRLKDELYQKVETGGGGGGYAVKKHGDATVGLVGPPSVGKSSLINKLCNTSSKVGGYDFTTTRVIPGMMNLNGARIQFFDLPGLIKEGFLGKGGGRQVLAAARTVDLFLLIADQTRLDEFLIINQELYQAGFRLNQKPPQISIKKTSKGGVKVFGSTSLPFQTIKEIAQELGLKNAEIAFQESIGDARLLIDALSKNRTYLSALTVVNKIDLLSDKEKEEIKKQLNPIFISVEKNEGIEKLKDEIWEKLLLIRVYLKKREKQEAEKDPLILPVGSSIKDLIRAVNSEWLEIVTSVLIWGKKVKYPGQRVSLNYQLIDGDIVYLVK